MDPNELPHSPSPLQGSHRNALMMSHLTIFQTYMVHEGPYQDKAKQIYRELRKNVVDNVVKVCGTKTLQGFTKTTQEYERTGYVWEQYDAVTGEGRRRHVALQ